MPSRSLIIIPVGSRPHPLQSEPLGGVRKESIFANNTSSQLRWSDTQENPHDETVLRGTSAGGGILVAPNQEIPFATHA